MPSLASPEIITNHSTEVDAVVGDDLLLRTEPAAEVLGVSPRTLEKWRSRAPTKDGPKFRRHGKIVVYRLADLISWSEAQKDGGEG